MIIFSWLSGYFADLLLLKGLSKNKIRKGFICGCLIMQAIFFVVPAYASAATANMICISMAIGMGGFTFGGISVNPMDLAPELAPLIAAFGNTFSSLFGSISPVLTGYLVTAEKHNHEQLRNQWQLIFLICAGVYASGAIIFFIGGSAKLQAWATAPTADEEKTDLNSASI